MNFSSIIIYDSKGLRLVSLSALLINKSFYLDKGQEKEITWTWNKCFLVLVNIIVIFLWLEVK